MESFKSRRLLRDVHNNFAVLCLLVALDFMNSQ